MYSMLLTLAAAGTALAAAPAPIIQGNQVGNVYRADMPQINSSSIQGYAAAQANANGTGLVWDINFHNFPQGQGPFIYHVHELPVPSDGNCTGAGPHLDPENRGEKPPCDLSQGQKSCQVGDLAGKHGKITTDPFEVFYNDLYQSITAGSPAFIGNRSIVIHNNQGTRIACANITQQAFSGSESSSNGSGSGASPSSPSTTSTSSQTSSTTTATASSDAQHKAATTSPAVAQGAASGLRSNAALVLGAGALLAGLL